ncbi:tRNA glutamyl-Q(34) synthetase GluQRS [Candidatus Viadribacter manganicus]|uniref:Glutamyl-Q tRNA(Asp) synthetase n=1 Tax=Candidatus Viadribacter manganicus TaxID=1759059 RepID=A0A1B1AK03_9PROT|nr:tRNA glutamyl-Q(34) synthetase GluQRS [Candidatus Viadribacter manganicus]ANP46894.1 glutamyl-Q tRNA(Asp) synthetase [Candidatus Viadribacter manganicus]
MSFVTRFAPSPTGHLHLGHAFSALTAFDAARATGGRFVLRIEDIDQGRSRPAFEASIFEDLGWLGIEWERPVRRQSQHMSEYEAALKTLVERQLVYRCFRTRKEIAEAIASAPHGEAEEAFRGEALPPEEENAKLEAGEAFAWRLSLKKARAALGPAYFTLVFEDETQLVRAEPEKHGDVVLARKDFGTSYHLASVWDDALQGVTHVIRGEDLREAAHLHVLLQKLLKLPQPIYRHHRLILGEDGKRLAKRDSAATLKALREAGKTPADIRAMVGL